ncbi:hypothetical protein ABW19_dt0202949 [Dactylella cylindrospora]|nr:hypothetical protein ABW19_dt0202949 [Dactylella cylindrospora]
MSLIMTIARGLLIAAWLSLVVAIPIPDGSGDEDSSGTVQGKTKAPFLGLTSPRSGLTPGVPSTGRTTTQTGGQQATAGMGLQQAIPQTNQEISPNQIVSPTTNRLKVDTSLSKYFSGSSDSNRGGTASARGQGQQSGSLLPPGQFSQPPEWWVSRNPNAWAGKYIEGMPPPNGIASASETYDMHKGPVTGPLTTPPQSRGPTLQWALSGSREGIFREDSKPGYGFSRQYNTNTKSMLGQQKGSAPSSSRKVNGPYSGEPEQMAASKQNAEESDAENFARSFRERYPDFSLETLPFVHENPNLEGEFQTPEKAVDLGPRFGFENSNTVTPRVEVPQVQFKGAGGGGGPRAGGFGRSPAESSDTGTLAQQYGTQRGSGVPDFKVEDLGEILDLLEPKNSCDLTADLDCKQGKLRSLAQMVPSSENFLRHPGMQDKAMMTTRQRLTTKTQDLKTGGSPGGQFGKGVGMTTTSNANLK